MGLFPIVNLLSNYSANLSSKYSKKRKIFFYIVIKMFFLKKGILNRLDPGWKNKLMYNILQIPIHVTTQGKR